MPQGHADKDKAPSGRPRILHGWTRAEGPCMAAHAGARGSGKLHVGTAKDKKGWRRAASTTTAEPDKNMKPLSAP